jgi:hypothetical protein
MISAHNAALGVKKAKSPKRMAATPRMAIAHQFRAST